MSKKSLQIRGTTVTIIILFILASCNPIIAVFSNKTNQIEPDEDVLVTCYTFGFPGEPVCEVTISTEQAELLLIKLEELQLEIAQDPGSQRTKQLQDEIIDLASNNNLLPEELSPEIVKSQLHPNHVPQHHRRSFLPPLQNRASEWFCNFASAGSGSALPIIVLPRLIPILLIPIPRLFVHWSTMTGVTSCGGLVSRTGFIAYGQQKGTALGFWGIGFSVFLPPIMAYGLLGYALYATVSAEEIEYWPPNYPPEVTAISPPDGAENVPISTSELKFSLDDFNGDLMSYTVTTYPDIGSGSDTDVSNGIYTVPISGLEGTELYIWEVEVSDGENLVTEAFTFTTEPVAPIVYDPSPPDGARNMPIELSELRFSLIDPQGDPMDYTVETSPDIGSDGASGVGDGTYTVDISGLDYDIEYTWYVNVTDGEHWKHKVYDFKTRPISGPWWNDDWAYRKEIIVDYSKVEGNFNNFPVLIALGSDADIASHAQDDGDDIVFTDYSGIQLNHELELFDHDSGELVAWANVPTLTSDTILYMYYGNLECNNQQNIEETWSSEYVMIQHLEESSGTHYDSTSNNHDSSIVSVTDQTATGKIDGADDFESSNLDYIDIPDSIDWDFLDKPLTISFWVKLESDKRMMYISQRSGESGGGFELYHHSDKDHLSWNYDPWTGVFRAPWNPSLNIWYHIAVTRVGDTHTIYVDGSNIGSTTNSGSFADVTGVVRIGGYSFEGTYETDGILDEIRILNVGRNQEWISTEYNNQNDPSSFFSFGPEEPGP